MNIMLSVALDGFVLTYPMQDTVETVGWKVGGSMCFLWSSCGFILLG